MNVGLAMKSIPLICFIIITSELLAQPKSSPEFFLRVKRKKIDVLLRAAEFKKHDMIADIGAGSGWLDAALGVYVDSLQFVLEDVDTLHAGSDLKKALKSYNVARGKPVTCTYNQTLGTNSSTLLPASTFDKVMLIDSYHHLDLRSEMLTDVFRILKAGGKVIVYESIARREGEKYRPCGKIIYTIQQITTAFVSAGFTAGPVYRTVNSYRSKVRVLTFLK
jgi:ubiquinone/menaquinone biosynthesis C-methylase UbiE